MKQKIKIYFTDFWKGFDVNDNIFTRRLAPYYDLEVTPEADYLFYSFYGNKHLNYPDAIKIYFTGENDVPDFNFCDYGIGFQHITFEDRYLRFPLYLLYEEYAKLSTKKVLSSDLTNRKFCNFVYSNANHSSPIREEFFCKLLKYKKVDSGGRLLNNIGGPVADKLEFIKDYKFTIAFENSSVSGYTTEKIMQPMTVNSLPIYWGSKSVDKDFNIKSFIDVQSFSSMEQAIEEIIRLDNDNEAYIKMLSEPWQTEEQRSIDWEGNLIKFLDNIFSQPKEEARRTTIYGFVGRQKYREKKFATLADIPIIRKIFN